LRAKIQNKYALVVDICGHFSFYPLNKRTKAGE